MRDLDELFAALATSAFRGRFHLGAREREYLRAKGLPTALEHACDVVARRRPPDAAAPRPALVASA